MLIGAGICLAMLLVAALLPLAFRHSASTGERGAAQSESEKRSALFKKVWSGTAGLNTEVVESPARSTVSYCEDVFQSLTRRWVHDFSLDSQPVPTGSEYTVTWEGDTRLRLCRMWLQARGDWQNWIDACFDADTGEVYYLYVSRECLTNRRKYADDERLTASAVAAWLAESYKGSLQSLEQGSDGDYQAVISGEYGTFRFAIRCIWYDTLRDVHITIV